MNFGFEWVWLHFNSAYFEKTPKARLAQFQFTLNAVSAFGMSMMILVYAFFIGRLGVLSGMVAGLIFFGAALVSIRWGLSKWGPLALSQEEVLT